MLCSDKHYLSANIDGMQLIKLVQLGKKSRMGGLLNIIINLFNILY